MFFEEIDKGDYDCVVTYGSSHSNHCRVTANCCAARGLGCVIISPSGDESETFNGSLLRLFGAKVIRVPVEQVSDTIDKTLEELRSSGKKPFFIPGGGHGNTGTQAYVDCYKEITAYEKENGIHFDHIFFASGTGTTQAGLVCGQLMQGDKRSIVGISIARKNPRGRNVVIESVRDYLAYAGFPVDDEKTDKAVIFEDAYTGAGYAGESGEVCDTVRGMMCRFGIPMDTTYTGKAYHGMTEYLINKGIIGCDILFIHTGGTPLFFDYLKGKGI